MNSAALKRIMREAKQLAHPTYEYAAYPLEDNMFEWHFSIRGPEGTDFEGGVYHGIIRLPPEYPMRPPSILFLTPNGRFKVNERVCLSISDYHPESWQPAWSIRTVLVALIAFLPTPGRGAVGAIDCSTTQRQKLAKQSQSWTCSVCGHHPVKDLSSEKKHRSAEEEEATKVASQLVQAEAKEAAASKGKRDNDNSGTETAQERTHNDDDDGDGDSGGGGGGETSASDNAEEQGASAVQHHARPAEANSRQAADTAVTSTDGCRGSQEEREEKRDKEGAQHQGRSGTATASQRSAPQQQQQQQQRPPPPQQQQREEQQLQQQQNGSGALDTRGYDAALACIVVLILALVLQRVLEE